MRRSILVGTLLLVLAAGWTPRASAASAIQIRKVYYNPPGTDTGTNTSLNGEYVLLKNVSTYNKSLTGWTIRDAQGHVYKFGTFTLRAGYSVYVHTGRGTNSSTHRYWGQSNYIWNNGGDTATLKNASGVTQDTCRYSGTSAGYINC